MVTACDEVEGLHEALEEARKQVVSSEGRLQGETTLHNREEGLRWEEALKWERVEVQARKAGEDYREERGFADVANAA